MLRMLSDSGADCASDFEHSFIDILSIPLFDQCPVRLCGWPALWLVLASDDFDNIAGVALLDIVSCAYMLIGFCMRDEVPMR